MSSKILKHILTQTRVFAVHLIGSYELVVHHGYMQYLVWVYAYLMYTYAVCHYLISCSIIPLVKSF